MGVSFQELRELECKVVWINQTSSIGNARPGDLVSKIRDRTQQHTEGHVVIEAVIPKFSCLLTISCQERKVP